MDQIISNGRIARLTKARKPHQCKKCLGWIERGELYYAVTIAGSGVDGMKDVDRVHAECLPEGIRNEGNHIRQGQHR